jgi:tRNA (guanine-N7-)-methyltransferase
MTRVPLRPEPAGAELLRAPGPLDWDRVFEARRSTPPPAPLDASQAPTARPLELEIGCGAGGFALEYCRQHPEVRYLAFEWRKKFAREVGFRASKHHLDNLIAVEGDARIEVPRLFALGSLDAIHLQFPDPWWKRAHQKRAILRRDFVDVLFLLLKPGGWFDFRTDVEERGVSGLAVLEAAGFDNPLGRGAFHPAQPGEIPSTRERRYLVTGQPVFRARLV